MVFLTYKTYSFSLLFSSSTTSFSNYPLCWVISLWTKSWSPKIQEKKRWETTYMEITTMPQIKITPTTLLMMVKFNRKCNFITQSEMKSTIRIKELPHQKDLTALSEGSQICHWGNLRPVSGRKLNLNIIDINKERSTKQNYKNKFRAKQPIKEKFPSS